MRQIHRLESQAKANMLTDYDEGKGSKVDLGNMYKDNLGMYHDMLKKKDKRNQANKKD